MTAPYEGDWVVFLAQHAGQSVELTRRVLWRIERHTTTTTLLFTVEMGNTFQANVVLVPSDPDFPRLTRFRVGPLVNLDHKAVHPKFQELGSLIRASLDGGLHVMELKSTKTPAGQIEELWLQGMDTKIVLRRP